MSFLITAVVTSSLVSTGVSVYNSAKSRTQQKKMQDAAIARQDAATLAAETKAAKAESDATAAASDKMKKKRMAQTQTILTSPLGTQDDPNIGQSSILGG